MNEYFKFLKHEIGEWACMRWCLITGVNLMNDLEYDTCCGFENFKEKF